MARSAGAVMCGGVYGCAVLSNYRVIELGMWVAGPAAGGLLADWGADVVKVETPVGDPMRRLFALLAGHGQPESPPFDLDNRGKRSVVIDLAQPEGVEVLDTLLADADVFLTNLRPEAVERLGLGPEALAERFPRLVYASVSGYGLAGPETGRAGYDVGAFWARSGIASLMAPGDADPPGVRSGMGDHVTALTAVAGILAALLAREQTGKGQLVEISLLRTGIYTVGWDLGIQARFDKLGSVQPRATELNPMCNCYQAGDGRWFWLLGVEADRLWPKLCAALERRDLLDDERYATARSRRHHAAELVGELDAIFAGSSRDELTAVFDRHDVWWAPVNTPAEVLADPQAIAAGAFVDVPAGEFGPAHRAVATPVVFHGTEGHPLGAVPGLGQHTDEVLARAGYDDAARDRLRAAGIVA
jgi:crotonobetainyl-CoA:carnitine CoA-transferase CaiB-like acyl-CoA transferase